MSKVKNRQKLQKEITEYDLKQTYFVPMKRMNEVIALKNSAPPIKSQMRCDYNLLDLKRERSNRQFFDLNKERYSSPKHIALFVSTCYKALYAHDWDRLLYILKRVPKWKFNQMYMIHIRFLSLLLMYHPDSQEKGFFNEYLHMVWGCRTDPDKKAIQKTLLTLRKRMFCSSRLQQTYHRTKIQRREAFAAMEEKENNEE